jgi:hypothetical protein
MEHSGNILGECHAPCKLNISYVDFEKELAHCFCYKILFFSPLSNSAFFSVVSNVVGPVRPSIPYFYVVFIYCVVLVPFLKIAEILLTGQ